VSRLVTACSIRARSINIERAYQQFQRLRELVAQAEHSHKARRIVKPYERQEAFVMNKRDDQRAQELNSLKLASATFAPSKRA
jgi:hypothetical protein